ncbi:hypothetical protein S1OALGB6SA_2281, partial [Olavius algarvensis spirochete endosymbiont]
ARLPTATKTMEAVEVATTKTMEAVEVATTTMLKTAKTSHQVAIMKTQPARLPTATEMRTGINLGTGLRHRIGARKSSTLLLSIRLIAPVPHIRL